MEIIIGALLVAVIVQEWRIHRLTERLLMQANVPAHLGPVRAAPPTAKNDDNIERPNTRRKVFSVQIPS